MKTFITALIVAILLLVGGMWFSQTMKMSDPNIIATEGLHWHPRLEIYVDGKPVEIPKDLGTSIHYEGLPTYDYYMRMTAIHTHDDLPVIHIEFNSRVTKDDIKLGNFFKIWRKDFNSFGSLVSMTVNGEKNTALENYEMHDGDEIVLKYESL